MPEQDADKPLAGLRLDRISTHMTTLQDAERFVMRYGKAIRGYVTAILRDPAEGEEVVQELILGLFAAAGQRRGRARAGFAITSKPRRETPQSRICGRRAGSARPN